MTQYPTTTNTTNTTTGAPGATHHTPPLERELPMLAGIGAFVTWCEDLLNILSGPVITAGLAIALVALLTDGDLLVKIPAMLYIWAASMALGLDAQFVGAAAKMARAIRQRHWLAVFGYAVLCSALGYVGFIASNVFATQEANGITTAEALTRLGMDSTSWIFQRSLLAVVLVFLSGFLRYVAPAKDAALSAEEEREKLEREIALLPLRQQLRAQQLRGVRGAGAALLGREQTDAQPTPAPLRSMGAAMTAPVIEPELHQLTPRESLTSAYKAMHDWDELDGIEDEADPNDSDPYGTQIIPAIVSSRGRDRATSAPRARSRIDSDALADLYDEEEDEERAAPTRATGRSKRGSQKGRVAHQKVSTQEKRLRRDTIKDTIYEILYQVKAEGEKITDRELLARANRALKPRNIDIVLATAQRWQKAWRNEQKRNAAKEYDATHESLLTPVLD